MSAIEALSRKVELCLNTALQDVIISLDTSANRETIS